MVLERSSRTETRCRVCGFHEVRTDEVVDCGTVLLAECPRCDHRWTAPVSPARQATPLRRRPSVALPAVSAA